jgi:hypothetical protein
MDTGRVADIKAGMHRDRQAKADKAIGLAGIKKVWWA